MKANVGRVQRIGFWSCLDEYLFLTLRKPGSSLALQGAILCVTLAIAAMMLSTYSPDGLVQGAAPVAANRPAEAIADVGEPARPAPATPPGDIEKRLVAEAGDTLVAMFASASIPRVEAHEALTAMRGMFDPRDLQPGHTITATFRPSGKDGEDARFMGFVFEPEIGQTITVARDEAGGFSARRKDPKLALRVAHVGGIIQSNLYGDGVKAGLPPVVLVEMIRLFSWDTDFQRDVHPGVTFGVMVEQSRLKDGQVAEWGDLLYAEITLSGRTRRYYRFESKGRNRRAQADYYDEKGRGARKALLKTPVDGARLSSGFGKRRHPILGYTRMHRGVDFAAPSGTPIYAAGNGTIAFAGRHGGYGRYIRIHHTGRYSTAYAHMRRFAPGIRRGVRVRQGQVIGYVGTTGQSTGPHLHYEVLARGSQVNPLRLRLPSGRNLAGRELKTFESVRVFLDRRYAKLSTDTRVTSR